MGDGFRLVAPPRLDCISFSLRNQPSTIGAAPFVEFEFEMLTGKPSTLEGGQNG